jgi:ubiquinone/menaquinone biosynthesis C-methylase UbiE
MSNRFVEHVRERIYKHRARWTFRRLAPYILPTDRVLDMGAGDCRIDLLLKQRIGCTVVPVDVEDYNKTTLPLTLFDGKRVPFDDGSFDVVLLIFVLHHTPDPAAVLAEARRVSRRRVIVFEDLNKNFGDRMIFRTFHRWLTWSENIPYPHHIWTPDHWSKLALGLGLREYFNGNIGRQLSFFGARHVAFVWDKMNGAAQTAPGPV